MDRRKDYIHHVVNPSECEDYEEVLRRIGRHISYKRSELALSQAALGEKIGVSPGTVSQWENGRFLTLAKLWKIAIALETNIIDLFLAGAVDGSKQDAINELSGILSIKEVSPEEIKCVSGLFMHR